MIRQIRVILRSMKMRIKRKVSVSLALTEEEAQVISAGLYALQQFDPFCDSNARVKNFGEAKETLADSIQAALWELAFSPKWCARQNANGLNGRSPTHKVW